MILIITIYLLAASGEDFSYILSNAIGSLGTYYLEWMLVNLGVLWVATLICVDHDVEAAWKRHSTGGFFSKKSVLYACWGFIFIIITGVSASMVCLSPTFGLGR